MLDEKKKKWRQRIEKGKKGEKSLNSIHIELDRVLGLWNMVVNTAAQGQYKGQDNDVGGQIWAGFMTQKPATNRVQIQFFYQDTDEPTDQSLKRVQIFITTSYLHSLWAKE